MSEKQTEQAMAELILKSEQRRIESHRARLVAAEAFTEFVKAALKSGVLTAKDIAGMCW